MEQLALGFPASKKKKGRRRGPKAKPHARTLHRARPEHAKWRPVHVTLRARRLLPSLRVQRVLGRLRRVVSKTQRDDFQIVHFSIQHDHVHMLVEAADKASLTRGLRSVIIRLAFGVQAVVGVRGRVWGDRYHRRDLGTPREVRRALVYVLMNAKKHLGVERAAEVLDPYSTALSFDGWSVPIHPGLVARAPPHLAPRTWLLGIGWKKHWGAIGLGEAPSG